MLNERQKRLIEITERKNRVTVGYLAKKLYVSEMTIRRDLQKLSQEGLITRYHGGAIARNEYKEYAFEMRMKINEKEKRIIAAEAEKHISNGQVIFLHSSSTCAYIIPCLKNYKNLTVITNSVQFLLMLSKYQIRCILAGGEYCESERALIGRNTESFISTINTDIIFLSCSGISDDGLITETDEATAAITRIAVKNSAKAILLADKSKVGAKYTYNVCSVDDVDEVIII